MKRYASDEEWPCLYNTDMACDCPMQDREARFAAIIAAYNVYDINYPDDSRYAGLFDELTIAARRAAGDPRLLAEMEVCSNPSEITWWQQLFARLSLSS